MARTPEDRYAEWLPKREAARQIGLSERTLERLIADGKVATAQRRIPGRKPLTVCDPDDVARIAAEAVPATPAAAPIPQGSSALVRSSGSPQNVMAAFLAAMPQGGFRYRVALTVEEAAVYSGLSQTFLRRLIHNGKLRAIRDGRTKVFRAELDALQL